MPVYRLIPAGDLALTRDPARTATGIALLAMGGSRVVVEGVQQIRQRIAARLKWFLGEWFLDLRQGVPYYRDVFVKNPNRPLIRSLFRKIILETPGVLSLAKLDLSIDERTRAGSVSFEAVCEGGTIVVLPGDELFLVDLPLAA